MIEHQMLHTQTEKGYKEEGKRKFTLKEEYLETKKERKSKEIFQFVENCFVKQKLCIKFVFTV